MVTILLLNKWYNQYFFSLFLNVLLLFPASETLAPPGFLEKYKIKRKKKSFKAFYRIQMQITIKKGRELVPGKALFLSIASGQHCLGSLPSGVPLAIFFLPQLPVDKGRMKTLKHLCQHSSFKLSCGFYCVLSNLFLRDFFKS